MVVPGEWRRSVRDETEPTINSPIIALTRNWADLPLETLWESSRPRHWRQFTDCINRLIVPLRRGRIVAPRESIRPNILLFSHLLFDILILIRSDRIAFEFLSLDARIRGPPPSKPFFFKPTFQEVLLLPPNPFLPLPSPEMPWIFKDLRTLPRRSTDRCIPQPDHPRIPRPARFNNPVQTRLTGII